MKRSLWVTFFCMGLALLALPAAWWRINQEKDKIVITEEVLSGNPAAAAGFTLRIASHWDGHLLWNTEYVIGNGRGAESEFAFSARQVTWVKNAQKSAKMDFLYANGFGTALTDSPALADLGNMPYPEILRAVAGRASTGEIYEETVEISDYYEYYPVDFMLEGSSVEYKGDYGGELPRHLANLFRIPTSDDRINITIERYPSKDGDEASRTAKGDAAGGVAAGEPVSVRGQIVSDAGNVLIADASAFKEGGCYYAFCLESAETGRPSCRGENCGIFYLPFQEEDGWIQVDLTQMEKLCPLPEGTVPAAMLLEEKRERLYLTVKEETDYHLLVYGLESGTPVLEQNISLGRERFLDVQELSDKGIPSPDGGLRPSDKGIPSPDDGLQDNGLQSAGREPGTDASLPQLCAMTLEEGGLLMTWSDNGFAFVTEEEGQWRLWCSGRFPDSENARSVVSTDWDIRRNYNLFPGERECLFDGERLALAALDGWESVNVLLAVYDESGEVYSGLYRHSGETGDLLYGNYQNGIMSQGRSPYDWLEGNYTNEVYVQGTAFQTGEPMKPLELSGGQTLE